MSLFDKRLVSFRALLSGYLVTFTALGALAMGILGARLFELELQTGAAEKLKETSLRVRDGIDAHLRRHEVAIATAASRLNGKSKVALDQEILLSLEGALQNNEGFLSMLVTDAQGEILRTVRRGETSELLTEKVKRSVADRPYFRELEGTGNPYISGIFQGRDFGNALIFSISAPIRDASGGFAGIVEGSIDIRSIPLEVALSHDRMSLVVIDETNRVVFASYEQEYPPLSTWQPIQWRNKGDWQEFTGLQGQNNLAVEIPLQRGRWRVVAALPYKWIEHELNQFYKATSILLAIIYLLAILVSRRLARRLGSPIEEIAGALTEWRSEDNSLRLAPRSMGIREIREIVFAIERFARRLDESFRYLRQALNERDAKNSELKLLTQELDAKVMQRTAELAQSEARYRQVVEKSGDIIYRTDRSGRIEFHNPAFERLFGPGAVGTNIAAFIERPAYARLREEISRQVRSKTASTFMELPMITSYGQRRWIGQSAQFLRDENGRLCGFQCIARDVTEQHLAEKALKTAEERYSLAVRGSNQGIWDWDCVSGSVYYSERWKEMLGISTEEKLSALGDWLGRVHPVDRSGLKNCLENFVMNRTSEHFEHEHRIRHKDGTWRWVLASGAAVRDSTGRALRVAGSSSDLTSGKLLDPLTGLENRLGIVSRLDQLLERQQEDPGRRFGVLFLDLDRFKLINDAMGHVMGDQLLLGVSRRLELAIERTMQGKTALARLGGDEFLIVIEEMGSTIEVVELADEIQRQMKSAFELGAAHIFCSISIGITVSSLEVRTSEDLLQRADTAMYAAKMEGRGRYCLFDKGMHDRAMARIEIESAMRQAIEDGEFCLYYQPQVELQTGKLAGFEALVRWNRPERGMVPPGEFIRVAEETGLILPLGRWVLRMSLEQLSEWKGDYTMSVNLSAKQFVDPELPGYIAAVLAATGVDAKQLHLEVTESMVAEDPAMAQTILRQLEALGVGLEIDDFGTGYSSLSQLHRLPFDTLKIDRSFVEEMHNEGDRIVDSILKLAASLGISVVTEGIETREQWEKLANMGCRYGQGYFFARPLPAEEASQLTHGVLPWGTIRPAETAEGLRQLISGVAGGEQGESENSESRVSGGVLRESAGTENL